MCRFVSTVFGICAWFGPVSRPMGGLFCWSALGTSIGFCWLLGASALDTIARRIPPEKKLLPSHPEYVVRLVGPEPSLRRYSPNLWFSTHGDGVWGAVHRARRGSFDRMQSKTADRNRADRPAITKTRGHKPCLFCDPDAPGTWAPFRPHFVRSWGRVLEAADMCPPLRKSAIVFRLIGV